MISAGRPDFNRGLLTQLQFAEGAATTQPAVSCFETEAGAPPAPAIISLAQALQVSTDALLGFKPPKAVPAVDDPETRRQWEKFQTIATRPVRDQKAVVRLIHSLVAGRSPRKNGSTQTGAQTGDRHGR